MGATRALRFLKSSPSGQGVALLEELAFGTEVLLLEVGGLTLFLDDGVLTLFLLLLREEDGFVLVVLVEGLGLDGDGLDLCLPLLRRLAELLVGALVGGDILQDVLHIDEGELLCANT